MTVQRPYTLPNCHLVVEGLTTDANDPLSPLSVLMNVECRFPTLGVEPISGGREFLDSLVQAVNRYGQQLISGIALPPTDGTTPAVEVVPGDNCHHLRVRPSADQGTEAQDITLDTIQFFDLMEALDQLVADPQTLPDLQPTLEAVPRRLVRAAEPLAQRAAPAALGTGALAAAAALLFLVPVPEFEPTPVPRPGEESVDPTGDSETSGSDPQGTNTPTGDDPTDDPAVEPEIADPDPADPPTEGNDNQGRAPQDQDSEGQDLAAAPDLERFATAPTITDAATLERVQSQLQRQFEAGWPPVDGDAPTAALVYRVATGANGDILGYKYDNDAALEAVDLTPLARLSYTPLRDESPEDEPVAQFWVTFAPDGDVAVELVEAAAEVGAANDTEVGGAATARATAGTDLPASDLDTPIATPITNGDTIRTLNRDLRATLAADLGSLAPDTDLAYRVRLTRDGSVLGVDPLDDAARQTQADTPLPALVTTTAEDAAADFKVVFTAAGVLEVSPWDGWPD